jgi:hypothetical protein
MRQTADSGRIGVSGAPDQREVQTCPDETERGSILWRVRSVLQLRSKGDVTSYMLLRADYDPKGDDRFDDDHICRDGAWNLSHRRLEIADGGMISCWAVQQEACLGWAGRCSEDSSESGSSDVPADERVVERSPS